MSRRRKHRASRRDAAPTPKAPLRKAKPSNAELAGYVALLAQRVGGDLGGFGRSLEGSATWDRVRRRLLASCRDLLDVERRLKERRATYLRKQVAAIGPGRSPLKIHVGGGAFKLPDWVNVDLSPSEGAGYPAPDVALDVLWGLPFADGSASLVFCSHLLEHLYYPDQALRFLCDVRRVLAKGGAVRLVVPDIEKYFVAYARRDTAFFRARRKAWPGSSRCRTRLEEALFYAGAGVRPDDVHGHKFGYDFETLKLVLRDAGFRRIERSSYMKSRFPALRVDTASHVARFNSRGKYYSLFVDATK